MHPHYLKKFLGQNLSKSDSILAKFCISKNNGYLTAMQLPNV